jgi:hypothetical protein
VDENKTNRTMGLSLAKNNFTPVATYENSVIQKETIYFENKGKAGIYR